MIIEDSEILFLIRDRYFGVLFNDDRVFVSINLDAQGMSSNIGNLYESISLGLFEASLQGWLWDDARDILKLFSVYYMVSN